MASSPDPSAQNVDDCTICLNSLAPGTALLTLSCNHKFHLECLASNIQASNQECPLCRKAIDPAVIQLLKNKIAPPATPAAPAAAPAPIVSGFFHFDFTLSLYISRLFHRSKIQSMKQLLLWLVIV